MRFLWWTNVTVAATLAVALGVGIGITAGYFFVDFNRDWGMTAIGIMLSVICGGIGIAGFSMLFIVLQEHWIRTHQKFLQSKTLDIGLAWFKTLKPYQITQVPPAKRTIFVHGSKNTTQMQFPWLTFIAADGSLYVYWSEKEWKSINEAVQILRQISGPHHNESQVPGFVCLGNAPRVSAKKRSALYWQTGFAARPSFTAIDKINWRNVAFMRIYAERGIAS